MNRCSIPHNIMSSPENENLFDIDPGETRRRTRASALRAAAEINRNIKTGTTMEVVGATVRVERNNGYGTRSTSTKIPHVDVA